MEEELDKALGNAKKKLEEETAVEIKKVKKAGGHK